jgi:Uma2 family endonuclease
VRVLDELLDVEAFLGFTDAQPDTRWELLDGVALARAAVTRRHSTISGNVAMALRQPARAVGGQALINGVYARSSQRDDFLAVPDVMVACGPRDDLARLVTDPSIIIEVLSQSSMFRDRVRKFACYCEMPGVQQIVLVYQDQVRIESFQRRGRLAGGGGHRPCRRAADPGAGPAPAREHRLRGYGPGGLMLSPASPAPGRSPAARSWRSP